MLTEHKCISFYFLVGIFCPFCSVTCSLIILSTERIEQQELHNSVTQCILNVYGWCSARSEKMLFFFSLLCLQRVCTFISWLFECFQVLIRESKTKIQISRSEFLTPDADFS